MIKFKQPPQGGWPERYKILCYVALNHIIGIYFNNCLDNEICSDKKIDKFFGDISTKNKKLYPNFNLSIQILKQMMAEVDSGLEK